MPPLETSLIGRSLGHFHVLDRVGRVEALVLSGLGEHEETLSTLEKAWEAGDTMLRDLGVDPPWWGLRGDPRYRALLRAMDLPLPEGPAPAEASGGAV